MQMTAVRKKPVNWRRGIFLLGMTIVPLLHFLVFYVYVNFNSVLMGFQVLEGGDLVWSLENFSLFFSQITDTETIIFQAFGNTMVFFAVQLLVIMPLTTFIAYFIYKRILGYKFYRIIFFLPTILSTVVLTILYSNILGVKGPIAWLVQRIAGTPVPPEFFADSRYALWAIVFYVIWTGFGTNLILLGGAMNRIPEETIEASRLDGAGLFRELWQIILPMVWPTMTTLIVFTFVGIFTTSGPILLFTKGKWNTYTISYWIFEQVYANSGRPEYASAVGLVFTVVALPIVLGVKRLMERWQSAIEY